MASPLFLFRADASVEIGTGHVMRCLTLARSLVAGSALTAHPIDKGEITFVCREAEGDLLSFIRAEGFAASGIDPKLRDEESDAHATCAIAASAPPRVVVVDHYGLGAAWEGAVREGLGREARLLTIDDLANRPHDCDLLLDQNLVPDYATRYDSLVPPHAEKFLGPSYALLREEFYEAKRALRLRDGAIRRILILFGGSDPRGDSLRTLRLLGRVVPESVHIDVVLGALSTEKNAVIQAARARPNTSCHIQAGNVAELMAEADLLIGASGTSSWERCFLGLPAITIVAAPNQNLVAAALAERGTSINLGASEAATDAEMERALRALMGDPARARTMSLAALSIVRDGGAKPTGPLLQRLLES